MTSFSFDNDLAFEDNLKAMIAALAETSPSMAGILSRHVDVLLNEADEPQRRRNRDLFNKTVRAELDALLAGGGK